MPNIELPEKVQPALTSKARFIVLLGGRGGAKSDSAARIMIMKCQTEGADILCGRELQNSIDESVYKSIKNLIEAIPVKGFEITKKEINCKTGGGFRFKGLARSPDAIKSFVGFKYCWIEEAQSLSEESIDYLLPTIRAEDSQFLFTANPRNSKDPFSERFINPYLRELETKGFYEDALHLIIVINWRDNYWHKELEPQRVSDFETMSRNKYDHIWEGKFNDSVESPLIRPEWFDACIDAHKVLGFEPLGIRFAAHDPSDEGSDSKGFVFRHGSVVQDIQEMKTGDVNEGGDWATGLAINHSSDAFTWDCDGLGIGLKRQVSVALKGKRIITSMFKGSESPSFPDVIYDAVDDVQGQKTNKEAFKNKRAQNYFLLRDRVQRTYKAVVKGEYHDPDKMISFDSEIEALSALRSELVRIPIKPNANGLFELYTKEVMKGPKFKMDSPNLADSLMMLMTPPVAQEADHSFRPPVMGQMGSGAQTDGFHRARLR